MLYSLFFMVELLLFMYIYLGGNRGFLAIRELQNECSVIAQSCNQLSHEVASLKQELHDWNTYSFEREQKMRQELHMKLPQEAWYRYQEAP